MRFKFVGLFMAILLMTTYFVGCSINGNNDLQKVEFNKVIDGNTIKVLIDGELNDVRLLLVDAPELRGNYPFSHESKKYLEKKLLNTDYVYLELDGETVDNYGKILAYVWYYNVDGKLEMLNEDVLNSGYGRLAYVFDSAKYLERFNLAQENAKGKSENIWSIEGYVTDKGYKRQN